MKSITPHNYRRTYEHLAGMHREVADKIIAAGYPPHTATAIASRLEIASDPEAAWVFRGCSFQGYGQVTSEHRHLKVHRVICHAWHGPPPAERMDACHNDGRPENVNPANLRWDTRKGNFADKKRHGTYTTGETHYVAKLTNIKVAEIKVRLAAGETQKSVARDYGVTRSCIAHIAQGRWWNHVKVTQ